MRRSFWRRPAVKLELRDDAGGVYVYDDENIRLELDVPPPEVFQAFAKELDRLAPAADDVEKYVTILARAFWLLHQKPKETGYLWWRRSGAPKVDEEEALKCLEREVKSVEIALASLAPALFGLVDFVIRGRRADEEPHVYHGVIGASIDAL